MVEGYSTRGKPTKADARIWRYMDFAKFISLIYKKAIFFPRADNLGDSFEGSFPKINVQKRTGVFTTLVETPGRLSTLSDYYKLFVKLTAINSWHINDDESDAMWKIYIKGGEGIAVQSTVGRLRSSLDGYNQDVIHLGKIAYVDYDDEKIPEDTLSPYFHKRRSFEHEKEYRAVIQRWKKKANGKIDFTKLPFQEGIYVPIDLDKLIEKVYLSPTSPSWQQDVIKSLLNKYGLNRKIKHSKLANMPQF